jgi:uncharacterized protein YqgV (UPF0045/DUF77 family)
MKHLVSTIDIRPQVMTSEDRVVTTISIDDRKGKPNRIEEKVKSIEKRIGKSLKK